MHLHTKYPLWLSRPIGHFHPALQYQGSLTAWLQARYSQFSVELLRCCRARPLPDEKNLSPCFVREVLLYGDGVPRIFAHSILPSRLQHSAWHGLFRLKNASLGTLLFQTPSVRRGPLFYQCVGRRTPLYNLLEQTPCGQDLPSHLWARRSWFYVDHLSILVTEVFLPAMDNAPV